MSLPTLVIGTKNLSSWSLRPWLALRHLNIAFDELELPLDTPEYHARIGQYSPTRRVPVLVNGDVVIWDSLAICEYANELAHGAGWPQDSRARAHARSISAEMHSGFQALRSCWPMKAAETNLQTPPTTEALIDIDRIQSIWAECRRLYSGNGPWLFGAFSIADAMYAPVVLRFRSYGAQLTSDAKAYVDDAVRDIHLQTWINTTHSQ